MDADYVVDLLRQFADCLEHPDPERNPLGKIEDPRGSGAQALGSARSRRRPSPGDGRVRPRLPPCAGRRHV